jgi:hypothetical protein
MNRARIPKLWIRFVPQTVNRRVENRADEVAIGTPDTAGRFWSGNGDTMRLLSADGGERAPWPHACPTMKRKVGPAIERENRRAGRAFRGFPAT